MHLSSLSQIIKIEKTHNFKNDKFFSSITSNSKLTNKNTIFLYDNNSKSSITYIREAIKNKTPAIITNKYFKSLSIPQFIVSNINQETELLLRNLYNKFPSKCIAVTGTNGKTSVVWYIANILSLMKYKNSFVGTLGYYKNGKKISGTDLTTPSYEELYKFGFLNTKQKNIYIFEASSHALDQDRLRNYPIDIAAITNISKDHLDYHKNMPKYKNAKLKLFVKHLSSKGTAIINSRIKNFPELKKKLIKRKIKNIFYGKDNLSLTKKNKYFELIINKKKYKIYNLNLNTDFELENLECAISCCLAINISEKKIINILNKVNNPPGRLQRIYYKKKRSEIYIDYAHTPDALEKILKSLKNKSKKPNLVFGCGGDRDKSKRKNMGIIAKNFASKVYITDDNPRNENATNIRKNILKYCPNAVDIANRKQAIKKALQEIGIEETLIIAGKGHEKVQIIKNKIKKFDDLQVVKNFIQN